MKEAEGTGESDGNIAPSAAGLEAVRWAGRGEFVVDRMLLAWLRLAQPWRFKTYLERDRPLLTMGRGSQ